jgi:hypothetical protein
MKDIFSIIIIFAIFGGVFFMAVKSKTIEIKETKDTLTHSKNTIFGPATFMIAIFLFIWGVFCFFGGPEAERGLRPIIYGVIFIVSSIFLGYKSI